MNRPTYDSRARVGVADVAVLVCWPTSQEEFHELWLARRSDLLTQMSAGDGSPDSVCGFLMDEFGHIATALLSELATLGARVLRRATLLDVREVAKSHRYIVLVAHHPLSFYHDDDIVDVSRLRTRLATLSTETGTEVVPSDFSAAAVVGALNALIRASMPRFMLMGRDLPPAPSVSPRFTFSRVWLDAFLGDCVRHGPAIELWSGLHTIGEFVEAFATEFGGAVDLIVCNSVFHAERLKRRAPGVVCNANFAEVAPLARLAWVTVMCRALKRRPVRDIDLIEASQHAAKGLK